MNLWNSLAGMVEAELTSADPEGTLAAAAEKILLYFLLHAKKHWSCVCVSSAGIFQP